MTYYATVTLVISDDEIKEALRDYADKHPDSKLRSGETVEAAIGEALQVAAYDRGEMLGDYVINHVDHYEGVNHD